MEMLLGNITNDPTSEHIVTAGYGPTALGLGSTGLDATNHKLFTIVITSPAGNSDMVFKDCVVTSLNLSGDTGTEGGRIKFSCTIIY